MQLEQKIDRKTIILLSSILILAIAFIISSSILIRKVNVTGNDVGYYVASINTANEIEENAIDLIYQLNDSNRQIDKALIEKTRQLAKSFSQFEIASSILSKSLQLNLQQLSYPEKSTFQEELITIKSLCRQIIRNNRNQLRIKSNLLKKYWNYTHITLIIACVLMVLLVFIIFYVGRTKKMLHKERTKNKFIFDNSINCISSSDKDGNIVEFNDAALEQFGYTIDEVKKLDYGEMYASLDELESVKSSLEKNGVFTGEVVNKRKDGSRFISFLSANLIYDEDGDYVGSMGVSRDITTEKEKEREFQNIINNAQDIIYTVDLSGKFTFVNNSGSMVMEYHNNELIGKNFTDMVHSTDVEKVKKFYANQFLNKIKRSYLEFKGITKEGEIVWLGQNITSLFSSTNEDEIIGFQGVVRNINKRKEAEEKLRKSEESFRIIVNTINDLFYLFDFRTDRFEYISPNAKEVLGVEQEFFYSGRSYFMEFVHKDELPICMKAEAQLLRGESYNIEYRVISNGRTRWIHDRAFPIMNEEGKVISYSGVSRDITEVKSANLIIEQQNEEINQSISYAKNIQESTLLTPTEIQELYEECFVFFNPRDVLSGDFYIVDRFKSSELGNLTAFAIGDCTGHGVPGGMLSFLCNSLLREAFGDQEVNSTSEVLDFVREKLVQLFRSNKEKHIHDGMDISLCALSEDRSTIYFSGANLPVMVVRDGDAFEIKGDRQHVGYNRRKENFTTQVVDIQEGDLIYMFSDGYQDQFGGELGKKFLKRRLRDLLIKVHTHSMEDQYDILKLEFHKWKGNLHQVDDVSIMGIRI